MVFHQLPVVALFTIFNPYEGRASKLQSQFYQINTENILDVFGLPCDMKQLIQILFEQLMGRISAVQQTDFIIQLIELNLRLSEYVAAKNPDHKAQIDEFKLQMTAQLLQILTTQKIPLLRQQLAQDAILSMIKQLDNPVTYRCGLSLLSFDTLVNQNLLNQCVLNPLTRGTDVVSLYLERGRQQFDLSVYARFLNYIISEGLQMGMLGQGVPVGMQAQIEF